MCEENPALCVQAGGSQQLSWPTRFLSACELKQLLFGVGVEKWRVWEQYVVVWRLSWLFPLLWVQSTEIITSCCGVSLNHFSFSFPLYAVAREPTGGRRGKCRGSLGSKGSYRVKRGCWLDLCCCLVHDTALMRMREVFPYKTYGLPPGSLSNVFECRCRLSSHCLAYNLSMKYMSWVNFAGMILNSLVPT